MLSIDKKLTVSAHVVKGIFYNNVNNTEEMVIDFSKTPAQHEPLLLMMEVLKQ